MEAEGFLKASAPRPARNTQWATRWIR